MERREHNGDVVVMPRQRINIEGDVDGDLLVETGAHVTVEGEVNGNVEVHANAHLHVSGDINGDLMTEGDVDVAGSVAGSVQCSSGRLSIGS
jgi:cytoskeletal protein CcmA (bactofilin family)